MMCYLWMLGQLLKNMAFMYQRCIIMIPDNNRGRDPHIHDDTLVPYSMIILELCAHCPRCCCYNKVVFSCFLRPKNNTAPLKTTMMVLNIVEVHKSYITQCFDRAFHECRTITEHPYTLDYINEPFTSTCDHSKQRGLE